MGRRKSEIAEQYLDKFPNTPTQSIARKMAKDKPMLFTLEQARSCVRYVRGNSGKFNRKYASTKEHFRPNQSPGDYFGKIPEGIKEFDEEWGEVPVTINKAIALADIHVPFHDKQALEIALNHGRDQGCTDVILNGDFNDFFSLSYFKRDVTTTWFKEELEISRSILSAIRGLFPDGKIVFQPGNHGERLESYLMCRAPELLGIQEFDIRTLLHLDDLGIQYVGDKRPLKIDHLYVIHGHEFEGSTYNPVNPARGYFLRAKTICIGGHYHQTSEHTEMGLDGKLISVWSVGCLCQLHPKYRPINKWNHGFATSRSASTRIRVNPKCAVVTLIGLPLTCTVSPSIPLPVVISG